LDKFEVQHEIKYKDLRTKLLAIFMSTFWNDHHVYDLFFSTNVDNIVKWEKKWNNNFENVKNWYNETTFRTWGTWCWNHYNNCIEYKHKSVTKAWIYRI